MRSKPLRQWHESFHSESQSTMTTKLQSTENKWRSSTRHHWVMWPTNLPCSVRFQTSFDEFNSIFPSPIARLKVYLRAFLHQFPNAHQRLLHAAPRSRLRYIRLGTVQTKCHARCLKSSHPHLRQSWEWIYTQLLSKLQRSAWRQLLQHKCWYKKKKSSIW